MKLWLSTLLVITLLALIPTLIGCGSNTNMSNTGLQYAQNIPEETADYLDLFAEFAQEKMEEIFGEKILLVGITVSFKDYNDDASGETYIGAFPACKPKTIKIRNDLPYLYNTLLIFAHELTHVALAQTAPKPFNCGDFWHEHPKWKKTENLAELFCHELLLANDGACYQN